MLFKKKNEKPANPYYNSEPPAQQEPPKSVAQQEVLVNTQIPLVPIPPSVGQISGDFNPIKLGGISTIDALRLEAGSKSFAFVKLSDFKDILDDIKALEKRIERSREDLEAFSTALKRQEEYIKRYNEMNSDLKKMIDRISSSLSDIQE